MDTVLAPFIFIPVALLTLLVCGMIFAAWYWRRCQALKRGVSMPVITRVAAVNTPVGHTKMTRTGYYPTHPNASSTWPPTSEFSTTLAVPSFSDVPLVAIKGIRNTPALDTQTAVVPTQDHRSLLSDRTLLRMPRNHPPQARRVVTNPCYIHHQPRLTKSPSDARGAGLRDHWHQLAIL